MFNKAIPTLYNGRNFRSRLEARWAAFLDLVKIPWLYEPIDLNNYIPDFILPSFKPNLLLEVKSCLDFGELREYVKKIEDSGWEHDALIVGATLWKHNGPSGSVIGLLSQRKLGSEERYEDTVRWENERTFIIERNLIVKKDWFWGSGISIFCPECYQNSFYHEEGGWYCYRCGEGHKVYGRDWSRILGFWIEAGNIVQWKGKNGCLNT